VRLMEAKIRLNHCGIESLHWRCDHQALEQTEGNLQLAVRIGRKIQGSLSARVARITLSCSLFLEDPATAEGPSDKRLVELFLDYFGVFSFVVDEEVETQRERNQIIDLLQLNGTAILFPYLRAAVTSISATAGLNPPFVLPTVNVHKLLDTTTSSIDFSE